MHFSALFLPFLSALAAAKVITVQVGATGLNYSPNQVTADPGDEINFMISPGHTVSQAAFSGPCKPIGSNAIFSGTGANNFVVTVNATTPLWFYCSTPGHCAAGMVFAVNPTAQNTLAAFKSAAANAGTGVAPSQVGGGVVNGQPSSSSGGSSSSSGSSSTASSSGSSSSASSASGASTPASGGSATGSPSSPASTPTTSSSSTSSGSGSYSSPASSSNAVTFAAASVGYVVAAACLAAAGLM